MFNFSPHTGHTIEIPIPIPLDVSVSYSYLMSLLCLCMMSCLLAKANASAYSCSDNSYRRPNTFTYFNNMIIFFLQIVIIFPSIPPQSHRLPTSNRETDSGLSRERHSYRRRHTTNIHFRCSVPAALLQTSSTFCFFSCNPHIQLF